jgi:hypothetical protein
MAKKKEEISIDAVETEEVEAEEVETAKIEKKSGWKVWTEEELAVLPREEFQKVEADIRNGKATVKQRFED